MKHLLYFALAAGLLAGMAAPALAASDDISVISREDGSGTRGAFIELFKVEEKNAAGKKIDNTLDSADITNSTSVMITSVERNKNAIGYISLGALNSRVKALAIDGAAASVANIKNGAYRIARPFNIATKGDLAPLARDFISFILSREGQALIEKRGYISASATPSPYRGRKVAGKIVVSGSSSVTPVMEKLKEAYLAKNPNAAIEIQMSDSTTGMRGVIAGLADIGMASRAVKPSELGQGLTPTVIAMDGIAVIVSNQNPLNGLASAQVKGIYTGSVTRWGELR